VFLADLISKLGSGLGGIRLGIVLDSFAS